MSLSHWIVLALAGGASFYGARQLAATDARDSTVEPVLRAASARSVAPPAIDAGPEATVPPGNAAAPAPGRPVSSTREAIDISPEADAFRGRSWVPPPPPAPPPAPVVHAAPPPPSAPPLPFRFVGLLEDKGDRPTAFLARGEALHVVRAGDEIDGTYRIDAVSPTRIVVTYLPLKQQQSLSVGGDR